MNHSFLTCQLLHSLELVHAMREHVTNSFEPFHMNTCWVHFSRMQERFWYLFFFFQASVLRQNIIPSSTWPSEIVKSYKAAVQLPPKLPYLQNSNDIILLLTQLSIKSLDLKIKAYGHWWHWKIFIELHKEKLDQWSSRGSLQYKRRSPGEV